MFYKYLIKNASKELRFSLMRLVMYKSKLELDYRTTVIDLLNIGTSYRAVYEFENLHDEYCENRRLNNESNDTYSTIGKQNVET